MSTDGGASAAVAAAETAAAAAAAAASPPAPASESESEEATWFDPSRAAQHEYLGQLSGVGDASAGSGAEAPLVDGAPLLDGASLEVFVALHMEDVRWPFERFPVSLPPLGHMQLFAGRATVVSGGVEYPRWIGFLSHGALVGTLAEVVSLAVFSTEMEMSAVLCRGRCRFRMPSKPSAHEHYVTATVRVMLDDIPPPHVTLGHLPIFLQKRCDALALCRRIAHLGDRLVRPCTRQRDAPADAVKADEAQEDSEKEEEKETGLTPASLHGTVEFSYLVARNLPCSRAVRARLLGLDTMSRLMLVESILDGLNETCVCSACGTRLSATSSVLAMSTDGCGASYVNAHGHVHEILTVDELANFFSTGGREAEHSYFPGYSWQVVCCRGCAGFVGWAFDALEPRLEPKRFFGLLRSQVRGVPVASS